MTKKAIDLALSRISKQVKLNIDYKDVIIQLLIMIFNYLNDSQIFTESKKFGLTKVIIQFIGIKDFSNLIYPIFSEECFPRITILIQKLAN